MTNEQPEVQEFPPKTKWQCTQCKATAEIDTRGTRIVYNTNYPADTGPYAERPTAPHDCPVRAGLLAAQMDRHPNAVEAK